MSTGQSNQRGFAHQPQHGPNWTDDRESDGQGDRKVRQLFEQVVYAAKAKPCMDCGIQYAPWVMQFDHREPLLKSFNISAYRSLRYSVDEVKAEIAKCDVVCANCHAERTHRMMLRNSETRRKLAAARK